MKYIHVEAMSELSPADLARVKYHRSCRNKVIHKGNFKEVEKRFANLSCNEGTTTTNKIGHSSKSTSDVGCVHRAIGVEAKQKICVFAPFPDYCGNVELHKVATDDSMGQSLLNIKRTPTMIIVVCALLS